MTGGTGNHNKITLAVAAIMLYALRRTKYEVVMGDMQLLIPEFRPYTYQLIIDNCFIEGLKTLL